MTDGLPPGSVIITPTKMYEEMQTIGKKVDHLATILDPSLAQIRQDIADNRERIAVETVERKTLEKRTTVLEHWRWFVLGVAAVIGPAGGFGASLLFGGE